MSANNFYKAWPEFSYAEFQPTAHLLHMGIQAIGKLKLTEPFEPHWANVALWLTTRGLTTGLIPFGLGFNGSRGQAAGRRKRNHYDYCLLD